MKYVIILTDGAADYPVPELGNKTPFEAANTPTMDFFAKNGMCGIVKTVPEGMSPGSDTANLAVMGYNPRVCYTGRSPLEAVSLGIKMDADDVALRCNLVTLSDTEKYEDAVMADYSAGEITTEEAHELVKTLAEELNSDTIKLYPGFSYRHCLILKHALTGTDLTPPHNISDQPIAEYLPKGRYGEMLLDIQKRSREILKNHPVNLERVKRGVNPATSCWFWGEGTRPNLDPFMDIYGLNGTMISAVDLLKGIGICAGFDVPDIEGTTGTLDTNYAGKLQAAKDAINAGRDFVYIHLEGPDECGHHGDIPGKVVSLERIDEKIASPMLAFLKERGEDFAIMVLPDHPTPIATKTHASDAIPFVMYRSDMELEGHADAYSEKFAESTGIFMPSGEALMKRFLGMEK